MNLKIKNIGQLATYSSQVGHVERMSRKEIMVEVRETNLSAQQFFQSQGFRAVGVLRDHHNDGGDAYVFRYRLSAEAAKQLDRGRVG